MVGVPRSTGCAICVQRRIKCDEARPTCLKCQKSGHKCPGYNRALIFRNSTAPSVKPVKRKQSETTSSTSPDSASTKSLVETRRDSLMIRSPPDKNVNSLHAPRQEQLQVMSALIDGFAPPGSEPQSGPSMLRDWLSHVYYRIGTIAPLDMAIRSVACIQSGMRAKDTRLIDAGRSYYISALQSLRRALMAPGSSQAELQSTVMLLTFYELMSNRKEDEWVRHSGGSVELMRVRGPAAYRDRKSFDYSMYLVCRYYIVMEAFHGRKACFLDDPAWNELTHDPDSKEGDIRESMFRIHVQTPGLLRDARRAAVGQYNPFELIKRTVHLRTTVKGLYDDWVIALKECGDMPTETPGEDDVFPFVYHFRNLAVHGFMSQHFTTIVLLNTILIDAGLPSKEDLLQERSIAAVELCKCVQFGQNRMLGSILMHFWLIIASKYADEKYQDWIAKRQRRS